MTSGPVCAQMYSLLLVSSTSQLCMAGQLTSPGCISLCPKTKPEGKPSVLSMLSRVVEIREKSSGMREDGKQVQGDT